MEDLTEGNFYRILTLLHTKLFLNDEKLLQLMWVYIFCFTLEPGKSSRPLQVALVATHADQISSQKDAENLAQHVADQLQAKFGHVFDIHEQVNHSTISGGSKINEQ